MGKGADRPNDDTRTLEETLASEQRTCPACRMLVANPFIERCPRCHTLLPHMDLSCQGCRHAAGCPVKQESGSTR